MATPETEIIPYPCNEIQTIETKGEIAKGCFDNNGAFHGNLRKPDGTNAYGDFLPNDPLKNGYQNTPEGMDGFSGKITLGTWDKGKYHEQGATISSQYFHEYCTQNTNCFTGEQFRVEYPNNQTYSGPLKSGTQHGENGTLYCYGQPVYEGV